MKILCVCQRGNVRSVSLAYLLKDKYHHNAVAIGWETSPDLLVSLSWWADKVIVLETSFAEKIQDKSKLKIYDVGIDRFGNAYHPELLQMLDNFIINDKEF